MKKISIILMSCFIFLIGVVNISAKNHTPHQNDNSDVIGFSRFRSLYQEIGIYNTFKLMMTPIAKRGAEYHILLNESVPDRCLPPNAWYIPKGQEEYCPAEGSDPRGGEKFVCGQSCPLERQTGYACGMGHHCCLPEGEKNTKIQPTPVVNQNCESIGGIQYCTFDVSN